MLRREAHRDLWDRLAVRYHLHPLSKPQTRQYLEFQRQAAGGSPEVFTAEAKDLLHDYTGGVPRQINNLATACQLSATASETARIDETAFRNTVHEFPIHTVIEVLSVPHKQREGYFRFLCPVCEVTHTGVNPEANLARCFRCERNFNPIELVRAAEQTDFVLAVSSRAPLLSSDHRS